MFLRILRYVYFSSSFPSDLFCSQTKVFGLPLECLPCTRMEYGSVPWSVNTLICLDWILVKWQVWNIYPYSSSFLVEACIKLLEHVDTEGLKTLQVSDWLTVLSLNIADPMKGLSDIQFCCVCPEKKIGFCWGEPVRLSSSWRGRPVEAILHGSCQNLCYPPRCRRPSSRNSISPPRRAAPAPPGLFLSVC